MAKSVLDIVIRLSKQGGADKETITGLVKVKAAMMDAAAVAGTMVAAGYAIKKAFDATAGATIAYAKEVRSLAEISGASAEETSRLIQVADDYFITAEQLTTATKALTKQGLSPTLETLTKLSDQYIAIQGPTEKAEFLMKNFGKAGLSMANMMSEGGDALEKLGDGIDKNLILTEKAVQQSRDYEIAIDNLRDSWDAFAIGLGTKVVPILNQIFQGMENVSQSQEDYNRRLRTVIDLYGDHGDRANNMRVLLMQEQEENMAAALAVQDHGEALMGLTASATSASGALDMMEVNYTELLSLAGKISDAEMSYAESVKQVNEDVSLSTDERTAKLDELAAKHSETTQKIISDNLLQKLSVDGLTQAEFDMFVQYQVATGQMTSSAAKQASAINAVTQAVAEGKIGVDLLKEAIALLQNKTVTITINQVRGYAADTARYEGLASLYGYAKGTNGFETVPSGYPNDSYPIGLTSGEKFAVIPAGGGGGAGAGGAGSGGGVVVVNLNMNSVISNMDREAAKNTLIPFIKQGIREAQAQGML